MMVTGGVFKSLNRSSEVKRSPVRAVGVSCSQHIGCANKWYPVGYMGRSQRQSACGRRPTIVAATDYLCEINISR